MRMLLLPALFLACLSSAGWADVAPIPAGGHSSPGSYPGMQMTWRDEFSGKRLDTASWSHEGGAGAGGRERQVYRPENTAVRDGFLVITATPGTDVTDHITSGRISTLGRHAFRFGRIDIRALMPQGQGLRPAIKLLGDGGAIEIVELFGGGGREDTVHGTLRWKRNGSRYEGGAMTLPAEAFSDQFHVFSITWDATRIRWLADDREYFSIDISAPEFDAFRNAFHLVIELGVGGGREGNPDHTTALPQHLAIDYIRVFQQP